MGFRAWIVGEVEEMNEYEKGFYENGYSDGERDGKASVLRYVAADLQVITNGFQYEQDWLKMEGIGVIRGRLQGYEEGKEMKTDWINIKYFRKSEFKPFGQALDDWDMDPTLMDNLDYFRLQISKPIYIHQNGGFAISGHSPRSFHYKGQAADFHIQGLNVIEQAIYVWSWGAFSGVGVYPYWLNPGLHVDIRGRRLCWYKGEDNKYHYFKWEEFPKMITEIASKCPRSFAKQKEKK